jgi:hypothetical protein
MENQNIINEEKGNDVNHVLVAGLFYFGTALDVAGHYFFKLSDDRMQDKGLSFPKGEGIPITKYEQWPFNPEDLPKSRRNGDSEYLQIKEYSIYAICGSCKDGRPGSKSVFFTPENVDKDDLKAIILNTPIAKTIIEKMPFEVRW